MRTVQPSRRGRTPACPVFTNIDDRYRGMAYELADAVAWFNQRGVKIQACKAVYLRDRIMASMKRDLK